MIAASAAFQAAMPVEVATAADRVFMYQNEEQLVHLGELPRPFALLVVLDTKAIFHTAGNMWWGAEIALIFAADSVAGANSTDSYLEFANWHGQVLYEVGQLNGLGGYWQFESIETLETPTRTPRKDRLEEHDHWVAAYKLNLEPN